jgi:Domain of Unknown Function with PDB structure (DUF3857)/Domain of Unknown Function with PDB structure (DUF3858)
MFFMKKIFSLLFFTAFSLLNSDFVFSQDENYDAVYLQLKKEYTLNPDGSMDYRYSKKQKLQTYRAFHNLYGESFIVYHPDFQSLKVNEVYTIMADGKKNPSPVNAFNEVLPGFAANAPAYNKLREMVITHSGTERNAILNLDYTLHSNKGFYPCLMGNELLCEVEPVKELTFIIRVPSEYKLNFSILNSTATPVVTKESNFQVYTWKFTNVPAISTEDFQKSGNDLYPRILFGTAKDRSGLYKEFQKQTAFSYGLNPDMKNAVAAISAENKEKTDILLKLQEKVVTELRLYPVPLRYTGFTSRTAQETWNSNGGTPIEKAVLLTALLKEAGVEANPVFMIRNSLYDESIGSLLDIEDILVKAELPGTGPVYLSVNTLNPQNLFRYSPERVFVELRRGDIRVEKSTSLKNIISLAGTFTVNEKNQLSGEISFSEDNGVNPYLMLLLDKNKAKSLIGGGLSSTDLKDPGITKTGMDQSSVVIAVQKDKAFRNDSDYYFLQLPIITNGIEGLGIHLLPKNRTTLLEISSIIEENDDFTFVVPDKMKPFIPNEKKELKNNAGSFSFEVKTKDEKVVVHKSLKLEKRSIQPSEYPEFKALMDHWNADRYREVVFRVTK